MVGATLLGSELMLVDAEFYLVFLGVSALLVGFADLAGLAVPEWAEWLAFAVVSLVAMVTFRRRVYDRLGSGAAGETGDGLVGETALAQETIAPGETGRAELRGSVWTARNEGDRAVEAGQRMRVEGVEGLVLRVRPDF